MQDPYNFNNDRSISGFDLTQVLTVNWVYQLPFGPGMKWNPSNKVLSISSATGKRTGSCCSGQDNLIT